jgi:hypothetical protein
MSNINSTQIEGQIIHLGQVEQKSEKFRLRIIVVKTDEKYPQEIPVQFTNANVDKSDSLKLGDAVSVSCNLRGREYSGKWYLSLDAWRVDLKSAPQPVNPIPAIGQNVSKPTATSNANVVENAKVIDNDLPF